MTEDSTSFVLQLQKPIVLKEKTISEITLREPTAGELDFSETSSKTSNGTSIQLIALVSGLHFTVIKQMGARDYKSAARYLSSFLEESPLNGETQSPM